MRIPRDDPPDGKREFSTVRLECRSRRSLTRLSTDTARLSLI